MLGTRGKPPTNIGCADYSTHGLYHCGTHLKYGMPSQHTKAEGAGALWPIVPNTRYLFLIEISWRRLDLFEPAAL
jgi:hypothetical protein